jgi:starch synthase
MASPTRILFISGEVTPFANESPLATLTRQLAEPLQDVRGLDARLMMPCYGTINERKHHLHEVIRLSGTEVPMGDAVEEVTVKVASLPDTRMQTYFMDHASYFNRDGVSRGADGDVFDDNATRAAFFNRAVLETLRTLKWRPDVIHAFGWMGGLVPLLLHTEYADDDLLEGIPVVFTPDTLDPEAVVPATLQAAADLPADCRLNEAGLRLASASLYPPSHDAADAEGDVERFAEDPEARVDQLLTLYEAIASEIPA